MKNLFKISIIVTILFIFSFSYAFAIDMFLTDYNTTTNNSDELNETTIKVEDESYEENNIEEETLTTRK